MIEREVTPEDDDDHHEKSWVSLPLTSCFLKEIISVMHHRHQLMEGEDDEHDLPAKEMLNFY